MNLLLLPGNSKRNKAWLEKVEQALSPLFVKTCNHDYSHWETGAEVLDLDHETKRLLAEVKDFEPYCVFAKSAGSIVTCKATAEGTLRPNACVFTGFPMVMVENLDYPVEQWLLSTDFPITIIQNEHDPLGSFAAVEEYFKDLDRPNVAVVSLPGDTHDYDDFDALYGAAQKYLNN